jgi:2-polyprenyl-6-methoxyphenol hydroxylase-like FAD-dependent oxidoreductase
MPKPIGQHAVVVGAGIGGLTAAKALSDHFDKVTILDRDALPARAEPRPGTPQSRHPHALLAGGQEALVELFPDFTTDIERAGAVRVRNGLDIWWERPGFDPFPVRDLGDDGFCMSRPWLEFAIRRRVEQQDNIVLLPHCRVRELLACSDQSAVTGVRYRDGDGGTSELAADLVLDASGRGILTLALLADIGAPATEETVIGIDIGYSTAVFEIPQERPQPWKGIVHAPLLPDSSRGAIMLPIEDGCWIVALSGVHDDAPPGDIEGYMAFAKGLRTSTVYNAIENARRVGEIVRFKFEGSVRRHFEGMQRFPRGLLPIADAICRFNPAFGQGMSVAAQEACVLNGILNERRGLPDPLDGLAQVFFANIQGLLDAPWRVAEFDFVFPQTRGQRPADFEARIQYSSALTRLAAEDLAVHRIMTEVSSLLKPPSVLREPKLAERVMQLMNSPA